MRANIAMMTVVIQYAAAKIDSLPQPPAAMRQNDRVPTANEKRERSHEHDVREVDAIFRHNHNRPHGGNQEPLASHTHHDSVVRVTGLRQVGYLPDRAVAVPARSHAMAGKFHPYSTTTDRVSADRQR